MPKFFSVWPKKLMDENDPSLNFQFATEQITIYGRKILSLRKCIYIIVEFSRNLNLILLITRPVYQRLDLMVDTNLNQRN